jgi:hypothetical protein
MKNMQQSTGCSRPGWQCPARMAPVGHARPRPRRVVIAPPPAWFQAGCDGPFPNPGRDPVLEQKFFKRLSDLERPWPSFVLPCGEGGYCYNRNVIPYVWRPPF